MRNKIHWLSVILAYSTLFLLGLSDNIRGPLFPDVIKDLALSDTKGALLWAATSLLGFFASLISYRVLPAIGSMNTLRFSLFLMATSQFGMAMSTDFISAILSCFCLGASFGFLGVVQNLLVLQAGPPSTIQRLQAGLHSNYALASFAAPLFLTIVHYFNTDWRFGYFAGGAVTAIGFLSLFFIDASSIQQRKLQAEKSDEVGDRLKAIYLGSILALYVVVEIMVSSRLALYLRRNFSYDFESANWAVTIFFVGLLLGRVVFIFYKPNLKLKIQLLISLSITFTILTLGLWRFPLLLALSGLSMAPFFPLAMAYLGTRFPAQLTMATSVAITLNGLYVVLMHFAVGRVSDLYGIQSALWIGPICLSVAFLLLVFDEKFS